MIWVNFIHEIKQKLGIEGIALLQWIDWLCNDCQQNCAIISRIFPIIPAILMCRYGKWC